MELVAHSTMASCVTRCVTNGKIPLYSACICPIRIGFKVPSTTTITTTTKLMHGHSEMQSERWN